MKKQLSILTSAMLAFGLLSSAANATPVSAGSGLASPAITITFDEVVLANNTVMGSQYVAQGLSSVSGLFYNGCEGACVTTPPTGTHPELSNFANGNTGVFTGLSDLKFGGVQTGATFQFASNGGIYSLTTLLGGSSVETFNFDGLSWGIYGFTGISLDEIQISSPSAFLLDNLQLSNASASVPEPASLALMGLALAGMGFSRRKKASMLK